MIAKTYEFDAKIIKHEKLDAAFIEFPYDAEKEFGKKGQVKVQAEFDGYAYRGSLAKMGYRCHRLGLTKEIRNAIGKNSGDIVHVLIKEDIEPRLVEIPAGFAKLLDQNPDAKTNFEKLSFTHRKEYAQWITGAKKEETRNKRLEEAIRMLVDNIKHP
ncbi:MAG TPA: YdeI/OmpD-associated family protein [Candidatus Deferrimicrobium sp.]|nr:YdeI/OmpD-associated family protein [Candidatus Deferrimicrobium sp.]